MRSWKTLLLIGLMASPGLAQVPETKKAAKKAANPAFAPVRDVPGLPRVLILGDSISIGYTLDVRRELSGKANVHRPAANCGPTIRGLESLDDWLGDGHWDVIHFNFGLHDLRYMDEKGQNIAPDRGRLQVPLDQYEKNLNTIVARLKKTGATLIFATTTPVPAGEPQRKPEDLQAYNTVAVKVMRQQDVVLDDLYAFIAPQFDKYELKPLNVHFKPEGYALLGKRVAAAIQEALDARR
jgi:acyl-CoA thioesterase-1